MKLGKLNAAIRREKVVCVRIDTPDGPIAVRVQKGDLIDKLSALHENKGSETGMVFEDNVLSFEEGFEADQTDPVTSDIDIDELIGETSGGDGAELEDLLA